MDATSARTSCKKMKVTESKCKEICFRLFSFIFPNPDFSIAYGRKNEKIKTCRRRPARAAGCGSTFQTAAASRPAERELRFRQGKYA
jgi:hypothetical protein